MRRAFILSIFLISFLSFAQSIETHLLKKDVSYAGKYKATRIYSVLQSNTEIKHGAYRETLKGKTVASGNYKEGKKDGKWFYKGLKGLYEQKGSFRDGKKIGLWTYKKEKECYGREYYNNNGRLDSSFAYNAEDKLIQSYVYNQNTQKGLRIINHKEGEITRIEYLDTIKNVYEFYANGQLFNKKEYRGINLWNVSEYYRENGEIFQYGLVSKGEGIFYSYNIGSVKKGNINLFKVATYNNGKMNGTYTEFDDDGVVTDKGEMKDDKRIGKWNVYSVREKKVIIIDYDSEEEKAKSMSSNRSNNLDSENIKDIPFALVKSPAKLFELEKKIFNTEKARKSFSKAAFNVVNKNFDTGLMKDYVTSPDGVCRIYMFFKVNSLGELEIEEVKASNIFIKEHCKKVLNLFPTFIPASLDGKLVNIIYRLPLVFRLVD